MTCTTTVATTVARDLDRTWGDVGSLEHQADAIVLMLPGPSQRATTGWRDRLESLDQSVNCLRRDSDGWTVSFAGVPARFPDSKGMHDLARLLRSPMSRSPRLSFWASRRSRRRTWEPTRCWT